MKNLLAFPIIQMYVWFWSISVGHFIKHKLLITEEWAHICLPFPMRPLHQMRSSKSGGKKRKKSVIWVARTHFKGKNGGKTMVRGNKPWEKISREKTKTKNLRNTFWILHQYTLNLAKRNSINWQLYLLPKKFWVSDYFEEKTWNYS